MYYGSLELTRLRNVEIEEREVNGKMEKCISIPIVSNGLMIYKKDRVYMHITMNRRRPNPDKFTHYISISITDKKVRKEIEELGFVENLKFIGHMKAGYEVRKFSKNDMMSLDEAMDR